MLNSSIIFIESHLLDMLILANLLFILYILWFIRKAYKIIINQFIVMDGNLKLVYKKIDATHSLADQEKQMIVKLNDNVGNSINKLYTQLRSLGNIIKTRS